MVAGLGVVAISAFAAVGIWFLVLLFDDVYEPERWAQANPAQAPASVDEVPRLDWHPCPFERERGADGVTCATLHVPESRFDGPPTGVLSLAVAIVPAAGPEVRDDPVLYLEGGPGGSSVAWFDFWADEGWPSMDNRNLILIDQRGTGYSTPSLTCPETYEHGYDDNIAALIACHDRLVGEGNDLAAISTREHAADVADLRVALGLDEWNLFGVSYGTRVALAVIDRYPEGVRSVVLDSVYPPEIDGLHDQSHAAHAAFNRLFDACAADVACTDAYGDLAETLDVAIERLDADPASIDGTELVGADLVQLLFIGLYDTGFIPALPGVIAEAADDPDSALTDLIGEDLDERPGHRFALPAYDDSDGTFYSVECREEAAVTDRDATRARAAELPGLLGGALRVHLEHQFAVCEAWSSGTATADEKAAVHADVPVLMLAGGYDPVTPVSWATLAEQRLSDARLVEFPAAGHAVFTADGCVVELIEAFLDVPGAQLDVASCVGRLTEVELAVDAP